MSTNTRCVWSDNMEINQSYQPIQAATRVLPGPPPSRSAVASVFRENIFIFADNYGIIPQTDPSQTRLEPSSLSSPLGARRSRHAGAATSDPAQEIASFWPPRAGVGTSKLTLQCGEEVMGVKGVWDTIISHFPLWKCDSRP